MKTYTFKILGRRFYIDIGKDTVFPFNTFGVTATDFGHWTIRFDFGKYYIMIQWYKEVKEWARSRSCAKN